MKRFGDVIKSAQEMQMNEHGNTADTEVEIKKEIMKRFEKLQRNRILIFIFYSQV